MFLDSTDLDSHTGLQSSSTTSTSQTWLSIRLSLLLHVSNTHIINTRVAFTPQVEKFHSHCSRTNGTRSVKSNRPTGSGTTVAVIGIGFVGEQLVKAFATGYGVIAYDTNRPKIRALKWNAKPRHVRYIANPEHLAKATHFLIAVPTILTEDREIDTSYIRAAIQEVKQHARPGSTVVIESSVAVGMTRELLRPLMTMKGMRCGMSPEVSQILEPLFVYRITLTISTAGRPRQQKIRSTRHT